MSDQQHTVRVIGDIASLGALLATWVAPMAGLLTIVWTIMRVTEMITGRPFHETRFAGCIRSAFSRIFGRRPAPPVE